MCVSVSQSVCHTNELNRRSTDRSSQPIFTKHGTKVDLGQVAFLKNQLLWKIVLMSNISKTVRDTMLDSKEVR